MAGSKKGLTPAPRRSVTPAMETAIAHGAAPARTKAAAGTATFEKLSISVASDVAQALRVAAVIEHRVSESALIETALRRFLALPLADRTTALAGQGRRRRAG